VQLPEDVVATIQDRVEFDPTVPITVDLVARQVTVGDLVAAFEVDDYARWRLMEGLDDIAVTLTHVTDVDRFEASRPGWMPVTAG
jgi:3-isopropylmalate/(R)-2-methylmalate dehydratase small subunit